MDTKQNYYQLLHVLPDAPAPVIKASYRAMMQKLRHHPDLGGDPALAQLLNLAADTLCDADRRAQYDSQLQELAAQGEGSTAGSGRGPTASAAETARPDSKTPRDNGSEQDSAHCSPGGSPGTSEGKRSEQAADVRQQSRQNEAATVRVKFPARRHCLFCGATHPDTMAKPLVYDAGRQCLKCDAPSVPIEELPQTLSEELRRIYRHDIQDDVTLWSHWPKVNPIACTLQDLSLAGCAIGCHQELPGNAVVLLETTLLSAVCQIRYCKPGINENGFQVGLQFRTLETRAQPGTLFSTVA